MAERERGDVSGSKHGDFTDWDNPEDWDDEGDEDDDSYIPDPSDPDYDLSEEAGYAGWEPTRGSFHVPRWVLVTVSILLILGLLTPLWIRIT